ncbi:MAG: NYN domain-containing protein, partial [Parachlamydiaceae bacterium]
MTRTIIYIDGYNLYYSRLKGTPYKWLDIVALFRERILLPQDPDAEVVRIKYFTAPVKASYARHGIDSTSAQAQYLRALQARYASLVEVVQGFHIFEPTRLPTYRQGKDPTKDDVSPVWMIEEKQTDVNVALHAYRDAIQGNCEQLV